MAAQVQVEAYEDTLRELVRLLRRRYMTAKQIVARMGCSKMVAYRRLQTLDERGYAFETQTVREGVTGPRSVAYKITRRITRSPSSRR